MRAWNRVSSRLSSRTASRNDLFRQKQIVEHQTVTEGELVDDGLAVYKIRLGRRALGKGVEQTAHGGFPVGRHGARVYTEPSPRKQQIARCIRLIGAAQEQNRGDAVHLRERVFAVAVFADSGGTEQPAIFA